jgi:putative ABC transport system ATP-binding protein
MTSQHLLEVSKVYKTVSDVSGDLPILKDISLGIDRGESLAIIGASGSGKSTLLNIMAGLDDPTSGEVYLDSLNICALGEDERAKVRAQYIGFVFQNFQLIDHLTAIENVMLPLEILGKLKGAQIRSKSTLMLERVGLGERLNHYPRFMSGGEQQRVALARAFVVEPKILMADEPTGSLDFHTGELVMDLIFKMNEEFKTSLVLVTHDLEIAKRCSRRLKIVNGTVNIV